MLDIESFTAYLNKLLLSPIRVKTIKLHHIARLQAGRCSIELGFILTDLLTDYERISDHCSNIAVAVIELQHDALDSHRYLNEMKRDSDAFRMMFEEFSEKYKLPESAFAHRSGDSCSPTAS